MTVIKLIISILLCQLAGFIGSLFTRFSSSDWYSNLSKPSFMPPSSLFSPVWLTLYLLMGIALFIIWNKNIKEKPAKRKAISLFLLQLVFNSVWPAVFFGMQDIALAVVVIIVLWFLILVTIIKFYTLYKIASFLLGPYLLWVSFAAVLNIAILVLN